MGCLDRDLDQLDTLSTNQDHVSGSEVFIVTQAMDDLIEPGDDFGFDGSIL